MSEVAGRLAAQAGAHYLEKPKGGRGLLLGGVAGVSHGKVVVIGGGIVGYNAAVIALGLGAQVTILERSVDRMRHLEEILHGRVSLVMSSSLQIESSTADADVVIGAVLIPGALAPKLLTREMIAGMKEGSVFCDVAIDQGGCAETSRPTTHDDPVYTVDGVIHYCVANMPGAVPITSTKALTNVTLPYVEAIADHGYAAAVALDRTLARGVNVLEGRITYEAVAEAHNLGFTPLEDALASRRLGRLRGLVLGGERLVAAAECRGERLLPGDAVSDRLVGDFAWAGTQTRAKRTTAAATCRT